MFWTKNFSFLRHFQITNWATKWMQALPRIMQYLGSISLVSTLHLSIKILLKSFKYLNPVLDLILKDSFFILDMTLSCEKRRLQHAGIPDRTLVVGKEGGFGIRQHAGGNAEQSCNTQGRDTLIPVSVLVHCICALWNFRQVSQSQRQSPSVKSVPS